MRAFDPLAVGLGSRRGTRLNATKSQLDEKDIVLWSQHTNFTRFVFDVRRSSHGSMSCSLSAELVRALRERSLSEFPTVAFTKFLEILGAFPSLLPTAAASLSSVHLCEAPGAFVCALNHHLATKVPAMQWRWTANSLNPYHEPNKRNSVAMIDDDRVMKHTLSNWCARSRTCIMFLRPDGAQVLR